MPPAGHDAIDAGAVIPMPNAFNFAESPFDCLSPDEQSLVRNSVDIAYFRADETILDLGVKPTHLFVLIKGVVQQFEGNEFVNSYAANDCFDGRGLVAGESEQPVRGRRGGGGPGPFVRRAGERRLRSCRVAQDRRVADEWNVGNCLAPLFAAPNRVQ
jgi:hypothetical protein